MPRGVDARIAHHRADRFHRLRLPRAPTPRARCPAKPPSGRDTVPSLALEIYRRARILKIYARFIDVARRSATRHLAKDIGDQLQKNVEKYRLATEPSREDDNRGSRNIDEYRVSYTYHTHTHTYVHRYTHPLTEEDISHSDFRQHVRHGRLVKSEHVRVKREREDGPRSAPDGGKDSLFVRDDKYITKRTYTGPGPNTPPSPSPPPRRRDAR